jgi:membrane protein implicated in regulation of membrane protease activity
MDLPKTTYVFPSPTMGIVITEITQETRGRIKYDASYWPAELVDPSQNISLHPDARVFVVGRRGLTLLVSPS